MTLANKNIKIRNSFLREQIATDLLRGLRRRAHCMVESDVKNDRENDVKMKKDQKTENNHH